MSPISVLTEPAEQQPPELPELTDWQSLPHPRALAFLGDSVFEIFLRKLAISHTGSTQSDVLHEFTKQWANAEAQAFLLLQLMPSLTVAEQVLVRQARNTPVGSTRRKKQRQHRQATAFEALLGALHLSHPAKLAQIQQAIETIIVNQPENCADESTDNQAVLSGVVSDKTHASF
ncbi:MAG: ribonuclease III domain-containing protein [Cyanobacteria bacterium P01_H01_bin.74]